MKMLLAPVGPLRAKEIQVIGEKRKRRTASGQNRHLVVHLDPYVSFPELDLETQDAGAAGEALRSPRTYAPTRALRRSRASSCNQLLLR
jgi:hypothetical protein